MKRTLFLVTLSALLVAACAPTGDDGAGGTLTTTTTTTTAPPATTPPPLEPAVPVLQITEEGGFVPVEYNLARLPRYSLYTDGTFYYPGAVPAVYPGPLLPNVHVARLGADDYSAVLGQISRLGLPGITDEIDDSASARIADASTTVATYFDESGSHRYGVYALGMNDFADPRVDELSSLILLLDRFAAELPAEPYIPDGYQVWVGQARFFDPELAVIEPWTFAFDPSVLDVQPFGFACTVLNGTAADDAKALFSEAHQQTFWERQGVTWQLIPVPVLPGRPGCTIE